MNSYSLIFVFNSRRNYLFMFRVCTETRNQFRKISVSFGKFCEISQNFGNISVTFGEKREFSDYFVKNQNFCILKFFKFCKI